jgi:hypothetical protein
MSEPNEWRIARLPTGRVESFTVVLKDERADTIRKAGVGGICQLFGKVDGCGVERQSARIEAIEDTPDGGIKAHFVWAPDRIEGREG